MPKKIDEEQKEKAKFLLKEGYILEEVAEETGISRRTVATIKKELLEINPEAAQILLENKYNRNIKKSEAKYFEKIKKEQVLFEDVEEGWIFHLTQEEMKAKQSSKWWSFIVYPESAPKNWLERLRNLHCQLSISPLHDKDIWKHDSDIVVDEGGEIIFERGARYRSGDRKKSHWHCILKFDRTISYKEANRIIQEITQGPCVQKCMSLKGAFEYFVHLNNPEKYQYEKSEIQKYNGFIIEPTQADRIVMVDEIGRTIAEKNFLDLGEVRKFYQGQYEYINVISLKSYYFEKLTQVNFRKKFPEGRTQKVRIITDEEKEN